MTFPLMFLAAITCVAGFIPFSNLISSNGEAYTIHLDMQIAATSIIITIASIALATWMYAGKKPVSYTHLDVYKRQRHRRVFNQTKQYCIL